MTKITGMAPHPVQHILTHLRAIDREEIEAVRGERLDTLRMTLDLCTLAGTFHGWIFWSDDTDEPVACLGAHAMTPSCVGCWAFGTDGWRNVVRSMTRHIRQVMVPELLQAGFHRAECRALASRADTRLWLTSLGWKAEAVLAGFGVRHEDFTLFAWLADDQTADHPRDA